MTTQTHLMQNICLYMGNERIHIPRSFSIPDRKYTTWHLGMSCVNQSGRMVNYSPVYSPLSCNMAVCTKSPVKVCVEGVQTKPEVVFG